MTVGPAAPDSPCREFFQSILSRISSHFGRLKYVAGLRHKETGAYGHEEAEQTFDAGQVDEVLRRAHIEIFEAWLCLSLEEQASDLADYLRDHVQTAGEADRAWKPQLSCAGLVPPTALKTQQDLFRSDLETILKIFYRHE